MLVISCSYKKRVGKDTFYEIAKSLYPDRKIIRVAFADPLKDEVEKVFLKPYGFDKAIFLDDNKKDIFRPILQGWGSFRRELFDKNYWVNKALENMTDQDAIYIITDARYFNELQELSKIGAIKVNIKRDNQFSENEHSSEVELDNHLDMFDYTIDNNGTTEDFKNKIKELFDYFFVQYNI